MKSFGQIRVRTRVYTYVRIRVFIPICPLIYRYAYTLCTRVYSHIYVYTHTPVYIHISTYRHVIAFEMVRFNSSTLLKLPHSGLAKSARGLKARKRSDELRNHSSMNQIHVRGGYSLVYTSECARARPCAYAVIVTSIKFILRFVNVYD